ncbi:MAG: hypothetical protein SFU57_02850 [Gemmatimonadales bacterium]|nr:hypothetical protein [Gemmatimonadales bacterium]
MFLPPEYYMSRHHLSAAVATFLLAACGSSPSLPDGVDQSALPPTLKIIAVTPDSIQFEVAAQDRNRPVMAFGMSCRLRVQREVDGEWIDAGTLAEEQGSESINCPLPAFFLNPRSVSRFWARTRASLASEVVPVRVAMPVSGAPATTTGPAGFVVTEPIAR